MVAATRIRLSPGGGRRSSGFVSGRSHSAGAPRGSLAAAVLATAATVVSRRCLSSREAGIQRPQPQPAESLSRSPLACFSISPQKEAIASPTQYLSELLVGSRRRTRTSYKRSTYGCKCRLRRIVPPIYYMSIRDLRPNAAWRGAARLRDLCGRSAHTRRVWPPRGGHCPANIVHLLHITQIRIVDDAAYLVESRSIGIKRHSTEYTRLTKRRLVYIAAVTDDYMYSKRV